jgi:hypothetical protein
MGVMENEKYIHEVPPIKPGEVFVPEKEVREILKYKGEERKEKLAVFKEKLTFQKAGLAKVQKEIIEKIKENPDSSYKELFEEACRLGEEYGMNEEQKKIASSALEQYEEKHRVIEEVRESYPDANDLYKELFGKKPKGEVEIIAGPVTLYIKCHDLEDYENIYFQSAKKLNPRQKFDAEFKEKVDRTKGIQVSGLEDFPDLWIAVENVTKLEMEPNSKEESKSVFLHEEQHAIKSLFEEAPERDLGLANKTRNDFKTTENTGEKERVLCRYFRETRKESEIYAKDEILAYYKDGTDLPDVVQKLSKLKEEGGNYDYSEKNRNNLFLWMKENEEIRTLTKEVMQEVYVDGYRELLEEATNAIKKMETAGYEKDEIITLLTYEPLAKWGKVVGRVLEK